MYRFLEALQDRSNKISVISRIDSSTLRLAYSRKHSSIGYALLRIGRGFLRNPDRKLNYTNHMIMLNLHEGNFNTAMKLEASIQSKPALKSRQLYILGDFQPSEDSYSSSYLRILTDSRVSELSSYLISGLERAEEWAALKFPGFEPGLTYFFMNGTGPSPFNAQLGDIYLKVGHYNPVPSDREIVQHAVIHELTHIYLRNHIGFSIRQSEFGIRKFFDEGFAQYCGFHSIGAYSRKLAHADVCSAAVIKTDLNGLFHRIANWNDTLFNEKHYPLYQASMSFIDYIDKEIGYDALINLFRNTGHDDGFTSLVQQRTGATIQSHLSQWAKQLPDLSDIAGDDFCGITSVERRSEIELVICYKSTFPLYPLKDILVFNESGLQLATRIERSKRYEKSGEVIVLCKAGEDLSAAIIHDEKVQLTEIGNCV